MLIISMDPKVYGITLFTLKITGIATLISLIIALPLSLLLALNEFPGKGFLSVWQI